MTKNLFKILNSRNFLNLITIIVILSAITKRSVADINEETFCNTTDSLPQIIISVHGDLSRMKNSHNSKGHIFNGLRLSKQQLEKHCLNGIDCEFDISFYKKLFGAKRSYYILWIYFKYGMNLNPERYEHADKEKLLSLDTFESLITAFALLPQHLHARALHHGFYLMKKNSAGLQIHPAYHQSLGLMAMSDGSIFDPFENLSFEAKVSVLIHEIGHRVAMSYPNDLARSEPWVSMERRDPSKIISILGFEDPHEDFAETFLAYRLRPKELKEINFVKYEYFKTRVFNGIEYLNDICPNN
jgi:hypothetical protein